MFLSKLTKTVCFATTLHFALANIATAQLSEMKVSRFVAPDTVFALSINVESLRSHADMEDADVEYLIEMTKEQSSIDLASLHHVVVCIGSEQTEEKRLGMQEISIEYQFNDELDKEAVLNGMYGDNFELEVVEHAGWKYHVGRDGAARGPGVPAFFFPDERTLIMSSPRRMVKILESDSDQSEGWALANGLDLEADLSLAFESGDDVGDTFTEILEAGFFLPEPIVEQLVKQVARLELTVNLGADPAAVATMEMTSVTAAEGVLKMLEAGLEQVPGLLDTAEAEIDNIGVEDVEQFAKSILDLTRTAAGNVELSQDDTNIEAKIKKTEGLTELPNYFAKMIAAQFRMFENMRQPEVRIR